MNLVSSTSFEMFCSVATAGLGGVWLAYDLRNLARALREDRRDPLVRDRLFGYVIGMIIGAVGVVGVVAHHR